MGVAKDKVEAHGIKYLEQNLEKLGEQLGAEMGAALLDQAIRDMGLHKDGGLRGGAIPLPPSHASPMSSSFPSPMSTSASFSPRPSSLPSAKIADEGLDEMMSKRREPLPSRGGKGPINAEHSHTPGNDNHKPPVTVFNEDTIEAELSDLKSLPIEELKPLSLIEQENPRPNGHWPSPRKKLDGRLLS